jgi:hypothetical protein
MLARAGSDSVHAERRETYELTGAFSTIPSRRATTTTDPRRKLLNSPIRPAGKSY